ncbi:thioredoxin domain-containing protein [Erythrobacter tepidarius]|uniref:thioredoxin domain-containing protein n=1 Tax=Erythrobacter tepidarius TaxID=60454 RepID=UPI000A364282|nr:thioredoxin domain-containing protein [Erythrobacter tepidarius]
MKLSRPFALALLAAAPLALAACSDDATSGAVAEGEALPAITAPPGKSWTEIVTVTPEGGYMIGNPDAPLKLVEFASHTCSHCAHFAVTGKQPLKSKYVASGVVSFEQREIFLNPFDIVIATMAQCGAKEQMQPLSDEVWQNLEQVFTGLQGNPAAVQAAGALPPAQRFAKVAEVTGLLEFFAARGLSADQARTCLTDTTKIDAMVKASEAQAKEFGVTGTPTFVLNGKKLDVNTWEMLEPILQRAGAR